MIQTERLLLRELAAADAPFMLELLNEPAFHRYIGDRGVRTLRDAEKYLREGPLASYAQYGFGLWLIEQRGDQLPLGMCGLLQRNYLPAPDLGFALLERFQGHGYAGESAAAVVSYAQSELRLPRLLAITAMQNPRSIRLLENLGFGFERVFQTPVHAEPSRLFSLPPHARPSPSA